MLGLWRRLVSGSPRRKARRLARDAETIVAMARQTYRDELLRAIAAQVEGLSSGSDAVAGDADATARWLERLRVLHRESRRRNEQVGLTAHTLAIIELESRALGEDGVPARRTVSGFVEAYAAAEPGTGAAPGK